MVERAVDKCVSESPAAKDLLYILTVILRWITADYQLAVLSQLCLYMTIMKTNGKAET